MASLDYDVKLARSGETTLRHMLVQEGNYKKWRVVDVPLLPENVIIGSASPTDMPPDKEMQLTQNDWRKGIQDLMLTTNEKYYKTENADARFKGQVILSPEMKAAIGTYSYPSVSNIAFATDLTGWTSYGDGMAWDSGTAKKAQGASTSTAGGIHQDLAFVVAAKGEVLNFSITVAATTSGSNTRYAKGRIGVDDGDSTTWSDWVERTTTGTTTASTSVEHTVGTDATQIRLKLDYALYGQAQTSASITFDNVVFFTNGNANLFTDFAGVSVYAADKILYKIESGARTFLKYFDANITKLCVFKTTLYIALGYSDNFYYTSDLSSFTQSTLADSTAKYMSSVAGSFWISDTATTLRTSANPVNGGTAFSTAYDLLDNYNITGLVDDDTTVYVRTQGNILYLSGANCYQLIPAFKSEANTSVDYPIYPWQGKLYMSSGVNSLYEYDGGVISNISPNIYTAGDTTFDGQILSLTGDTQYLYCAVDNGNDVEILAGRWETINSSTDFWWHSIYHKTTSDVTSMLISSASGTKTFYIGHTTASDGVDPCVISTGYSDPMHETFTFEAVGDFITSWISGNFPTSSKYWKQIKVTSKCVTSKTAIQVYYQKKGDTSWTSLGLCTTAALVSGEYPPETTDTFALNLSSERIRFKFHLTAADTDYTPILYGLGGGYRLDGKLQQSRRKGIECTLLIAPSWRERNGYVIDRTVSSDMTALRSLYESTDTITLTAYDDTDYSVLVDRDGYSENLVYDETGRVENVHVTFRFLEIT